MKDLIEKLKAEAGITEEQATKSVQTVVGYIKEKVPPMMHGLIDNFMGTASTEKSDMQKTMEGYAEKAKEMGKDATEKAKEMTKEATEKMQDWNKKTTDAAHDAMDKLKDMMNHNKK